MYYSFRLIYSLAVVIITLNSKLSILNSKSNKGQTPQKSLPFIAFRTDNRLRSASSDYP